MPQPSSAAETPDLLQAATDPGLLRKLQRVRIVARRGVGTRPGNTPIPHGWQANGLELASHKSYAPGDDLRHFDWNTYGRLDQMLTKTFRAERESPLHLLIDGSASMGVPETDGKFRFAIAVASALAYVALYQRDPARAVFLGHDATPGRVSAVFRHPNRLPELQLFLTNLRPNGPTHLRDGIDAYLRTTRQLGTAVVVSDFLVPEDVYQRALESLLARGFGVAALRVIGPEERTPAALPRRVRLRDAETGAERILDLTLSQRERYGRALADHLAGLRRWCDARQVAFAVIDTASSLERCLFHELPRAGLLR
jgi:uncharacterized protein (DUF58 family)